MANLKQGKIIGIPCDVKPGPFSDERMISFDTISGPVSGFVRENELKQIDQDQWYVRATVQSVSHDGIEVRVRGSFFTTNGLATVSREIAYAA